MADETPLAYRAVRGGLLVALSSYWTLGFGFVANIFLTRLLSPADFGTFSLGMFFAQLFRLQTKLGLNYAFGQHKETSGASVGTYAALDAAAALCGLLMMGLAAPILRLLGYDRLVVQAALVLALAAWMEGTASIAGTFLEKGLHFGTISLYQFISFPLSYIPAFWLATHGGGVWSLVSQTATYSFLWLGLWWVLRRRESGPWKEPWRFRPDLARHFLRFGAAHRSLADGRDALCPAGQLPHRHLRRGDGSWAITTEPTGWPSGRGCCSTRYWRAPLSTPTPASRTTGPGWRRP